MKLNPPLLTLRSKISSRSDFIHDSGFIPTKADLVEKDQVDFDLVFFWLEWMGNSASLRDSLALRLASELADLRAANANHQLVPLAQA